MKKCFFTKQEEQCSFTGEIYSYDVIVADRIFAIGRLEKWWVFLDKPSYYPEYRKHLWSRWFWREKKKTIERKETIKNTSNKLGI